MITHFIKKRILKHFYAVELTSFEREMADEAVTFKYVPAVRTSLSYAVLLLPSLLILDTAIVYLMSIGRS